MVQWFSDQGIDLSTKTPAEILALGFARRNAWRRTDTYRVLVAQYVDSVQERKDAKKAAAQAVKDEKIKARDLERMAKAEAKAAAKAEAEAAKPAKATKAAAKPAAVKATKKATKATTKEDDPFS